MLPLASDRAIPGAMAVTHDEERVMMKGVSNNMLVHVVPQVAVKSRPDVLIDRLELDEHQRQAIDKTNQVRPPIVARRAQPRDFQLAHGEEAIVRLPVPSLPILEINHPRPRLTKLAL